MSKISRSVLPTFHPSYSATSGQNQKSTHTSKSFSAKWTVLGDKEVPKLAHGLESVINSNRIVGISEYLSIQKVPLISKERLRQLQLYTPPSQDANLIKSIPSSTKYIGSTSTTTGLLSQIYYMMSNKRKPDTSRLSPEFEFLSQYFTSGSQAPVTVILRKINGIWTIDSDKSFDKPNVLADLGHVLEYRLTSTLKQFENFIEHNHLPRKDCFHLMEYGNLSLRSQLDCAHDLLPKRIFDLKTRAVLPIRLNVTRYRHNLWYKIIKHKGEFLSFEREYFDMIRSAFLKYYFQVCIGNMAGIYVAYHNTEEIFGFQYISREELAQRVFGFSELGESVFKTSLSILQQLLRTLLDKETHEQFSVTLHFYKGELKVFKEAISPEYEKFKLKATNFPLDNFTKDTLKHYIVTTNTLLDDMPYTDILDLASIKDFSLSSDLNICHMDADVITTVYKYKRVRQVESRISSYSNDTLISNLKTKLMPLMQIN